jgi:hypothetical protein
VPSWRTRGDHRTCPAARAAFLLRGTGCHSPRPLAVGMRRPLSAVAMACSDVAPAALYLGNDGCKGPDRASTRAVRASQPSRRALAVESRACFNL